jgi:hypothetical protein
MSGVDEESAGRRDRDDLDREPLVSVREVQDEPTAILLCDFLKSQGIEATAVPVQISWFSTLQTLHHGYWGRVEVLGKDADRARALIEEYLAATPEQGPGEETA